MDLSDALGGGGGGWPGGNNQGGAGAWPSGGQPNPNPNPSWPAGNAGGGAGGWPGGPGGAGGGAGGWPGGPGGGGGGAGGWPGGPGGAGGGAGGWPAGPGGGGGPAGGWPAGPGGGGGGGAWPSGPQPGGQPSWPAQPTHPTQPGGGGGWPSPSPGPGPTAPSVPSVPSAPQQSLNVPYDQTLPNGVYNNLLITIAGTVKPGAKTFAINLSTSHDVAFHLNPRFNENGKQVVVRNSEIGKRWGTEERELGRFPFTPGQKFELKILCTNDEFKVAANGSHLLAFKHRVRDLKSISKLSIYNDVVLSAVNLDTLH